MSKKTIKMAPSKTSETKEHETTVDRLRRRIDEYQSERTKGIQQLQAITERLSQLDGAIYALSEELRAEEYQ